MAAPQIPNLLSLRGRGEGRGRGRGRGRGGPGSDVAEETPEQDKERKDRVVQLTDQDANLSRLSAVNAGYLRDSFAHIFTPTSSEVPRRMPIINRGTYARTSAIDRLVTSFVKSTPDRKQIISLGAGTDTRYFRLAEAGFASDLDYHEFDFASNTAGKIACMNRHPLLSPFLSDTSFAGENSMHSSHYHLHPLDLRELAREDGKASLISNSGEFPGLRPDVPTLILSECCLCYLTTAQVDAILRKLIAVDDANGFITGPVGLVFYEPIKPDDAFGRVMSQNLEKRGIQMPTLATYPSLQSQQARFLQYGLRDGSKAVDIEFVMMHWIHEAERERIDRCEMLDEMEELNLLAQHYCISFGWKNISQGSPAIPNIWSGWDDLPAQESEWS